VIEALVNKEMGIKETNNDEEEEDLPLSEAGKFEIVLNKLESDTDITQEELLLFLDQLANLWGKSNKYFYNNRYFHILLGDYIKIIQANGLTLKHFTSIFWGHTDLGDKELNDFYELSLKQDLNSSVLISKFIYYFVFYARKYFGEIDFNKHLNKQNILTLARFIYFSELTSSYYNSKYHQTSDEKIVLLDEKVRNDWQNMETQSFCLEYQLHSKKPQLFLKLYLKDNGITFFYPVNMWNKFLDGLAINGNEMKSYYSQTHNNLFHISTQDYVRVDAASMAISVDLAKLQEFITQAMSSSAYVTLIDGFTKIAGDI